MYWSSIESPARRQRDRLVVAAAETVIHEPSIAAMYVVLPADPRHGQRHPVQVRITATPVPPARPRGAAPVVAASVREHRMATWLSHVLQETDGVR